MTWIKAILAAIQAVPQLLKLGEQIIDMWYANLSSKEDVKIEQRDAARQEVFRDLETIKNNTELSKERKDELRRKELAKLYSIRTNN